MKILEKPILELSGLSKFYTSGQSVVVGLNQVSLSFRRGEFIAVTGESGSGKSTLAHVLGGILPYESGELLFDGKPTSHYDGVDWERYRRDCISFISQNYGILPGSTVAGNVICALQLSGMGQKEAKAEAEAILKKVDLWQFRHRRAARLSSGQKQRLAIARALAKPSKVLIADEPTGNLDGENSAKVIELLAEAAKERLVILITHEFQEAEDYATRRIALRDGKVIMDVALREANTVAQEPESKKRKKRLHGGYIARLQMRARPVWCAMMVALFAVSAFAVFAFLGTFIVALDDTPTRIYDDSVFLNGDERRIVVMHMDGSPMTQADVDALLEVEYVQSLERYGYIADIGCAYLEGEHYEMAYRIEGGAAADGFWQEEALLLKEHLPFMKSIPVFADDSAEFLTAGRLPEAPSEIVAAGDESLLGKKITVFIQDQANWNNFTYLGNEMTVVGITDMGEGLYFHDDFALAVNDYACREKKGLFILPLYNESGSFEVSIGLWFTLDKYMGRIPKLFEPGTRVVFDPEQSEGARIHYDVENERYVLILPAGLDGVEEAFELTYSDLTLRNTVDNCINVNQEVFRYFYPDKETNWGDQFTLTIENYAYTDRVLEDLEALGYGAVSPYQQCSTEQDPELARARWQTLIICFAAMIVILILQVLVLRAMFGMQTENYRVLSNMGLICRSAKASVFWQLLLFLILGQGLALGGIYLCSQLEIERILAIVRYITLPEAYAIPGVHAAACILATLWVVGSLRKQVYPFAATEYDLDLGTEVEA